MADAERTPSGRHLPGVYFVTGADLVKIGYVSATWTGGVVSRLGRMQSGSPVPLKLHRFIVYSYCMALERVLHERYAELRQHGEWFKPDLLAEIDALTNEEVIDLMPHRQFKNGVGSVMGSKRGQLVGNTEQPDTSENAANQADPTQPHIENPGSNPGGGIRERAGLRGVWGGCGVRPGSNLQGVAS